MFIKSACIPLLALCALLCGCDVSPKIPHYPHGKAQLADADGNLRKDLPTYDIVLYSKDTHSVVESAVAIWYSSNSHCVYFVRPDDPDNADENSWCGDTITVDVHHGE